MAEYICPYCKNPIYDDEALLCLYCGGSLKRSIGFIGKIKYPLPRIIATVVVVIVLLSFVFLILSR